MDELKGASERIVAADGVAPADVAFLKAKTPPFLAEMRAHLREEEEHIPSLLRQHFTEQEEKVIVQRILKAGGLELARLGLPPIMAAASVRSADSFTAVFLTCPSFLTFSPPLFLNY